MGRPLLLPAIKQLLRHTEMVPEHEAFELHDRWICAAGGKVRGTSRKARGRFAEKTQAAMDRPLGRWKTWR